MWQAQISYRRRLKLEKLTGRCALAIDIAPHNEFIPEDVNCDLQIDADDAQAVFRLLESRDSRSILRDDSIDLPESLRWDVNDDNLLSATDALLIVNRLHGEGENSKVMQVTLQATKIDGSALPKIGGVITVGQGEKILVKMSTKDLRTSPLGVAAAYVDLTYTSGLMQVNMRENQLITINGGPAGGSFTLTITNPTTNVSQTTGSITYDPLDASVTRNNIRNALVALDNVALGEVAVEAPPKSSVLDHRNNVVVRFGGRFSNVNVPTMTADFSSLIGGSNPSISVSELSGTNPVDPRDFLRSLHSDLRFGTLFLQITAA